MLKTFFDGSAAEAAALAVVDGSAAKDVEGKTDQLEALIRARTQGGQIMTDLLLYASLKGGIVLTLAWIATTLLPPQFGRSSPPNLGGCARGNCSGHLPWPVPRTGGDRGRRSFQHHQHRHSGGVECDFMAAGAVAHRLHLGTDPVCRRCVAAGANHSLGEAFRCDADQRRSEQPDDLGRDSSRDPVAGLRDGLVGGEAGGGVAARTSAHRAPGLAVAGVRAGSDRGVLVSSASLDRRSIDCGRKPSKQPTT